MPTEKRPLKVFLCHAHADRQIVRALYTRLTKNGVDVWLDKEKLLPGQDWESEIRKAVREADVVVVCLSKQFNQRGFRQKEVRLALEAAMEMPEGEIFIIPARFAECENLESLRKWHWVDLFEEDGYKRLMYALQLRADKIGATLEAKRRKESRAKKPATNTLSIATEIIPAVTPSLDLMTPSATSAAEATRIASSIYMSLLESFSAPGTRAAGITWDGVNLWLSDNSGMIFKLDPSGNVLDSFLSPEVTPQGMTWDGSSFWIFTTNRFHIYQFRVDHGEAQILNSFRSPAETVGGGLTQDMAWDGENLWYANQFKVYNLDKAGNVLRYFAFPRNVTGLDWDGSNLWLAYNDFPKNATINIVDTTGKVLDAYPSLVYEVNGLAWAGDYVWVLGCASLGEAPMIYKVGVTRK